jgi:hypothetical protein
MLAVATSHAGREKALALINTVSDQGFLVP